MAAYLESLIDWLAPRSETRIPGPGLPLLGDLPTAAAWSLLNPGRLPMHRTLELHRQYGPVYSFGVGPANFVVVADTNLFRRALAADEFQDHPDLPFLRKFGASRGFFLAGGERWRWHRRFGHWALRQLGVGCEPVQELVEEEGEQLVSQLTDSGAEPQAAQPTVSKAVSNVINRLVFGRRFGYEDPQFAAYLQHTRMVTNISLTLVFLPMMLPWLEAAPQLLARLPGSTTFGEGYAFIKAFCAKEVERHKQQRQLDCNNNSSSDEQQQQKSPDFIHLFLDEQQRLDAASAPEAEYFQDADLCDIVADFFVAGTDTTAVALTWSLLLAAVHQAEQDSLRAELFPLRQAPSLWQLRQRLHRTRAFIEETLRYCVLTPINCRYNREEATLGDFVVPAGSVLGANAYAVSRNEELFPQPDEFRPARFLDNDGCYRHCPAADGIAFGGGRRGCLGEGLARNELLVFLARILQSFQVELPPDERQRVEEILVGEDGAVHQPKPHRLLFTPLPL